MRKALFFVLTTSMLLFNSSALQANAAIVKTTIKLSAPTFVFAGVSNPIDVGVCPKASLASTDCANDGPERTVTLWANSKKVQTLQTIGHGGQATFSWTPSSSGSFTLKVTVAARAGLKALTSETLKVSVKAKVKATSIGTISCGTVCVHGIPDRIDTEMDGVLTAGIASGVVKGRQMRFQTLRVTNKYGDDFISSTTWQDDINRYGIALSFANIGNYAGCTPGEIVQWNLRFYVDATSKSPAAASAGRWIDIVCPRADEPSEIEMSVDYSDQDIDYSSYEPDDINVSITAPDSAQYSVYTQYCSWSDDCTDNSNWLAMDGYSQDDEIYGSQDFVLTTDPGDFGLYWVRVEVIPWTDQEIFYSDWYKLDLW